MKSFNKLLLPALLLTSSSVLADVSETIEKRFDVGNQSKLLLENINGDVVISSWDEPVIMVTAVKMADDQESLDRMDVIMKQNGDRVIVETEYRNKQSWGRNSNGGSVDYTVKVPVNTELREIDLVNGSLQIDNVAGEVNADLVNGSVEASGLANDVEVDSVNGSVELTFVDSANNLDIEVETVNGSIRVYLPADFSADVDASTGNGAIKTEFGLQGIKGKYYGTDLKGQIGDGGSEINLESVNGSIRILKN